MKTKAKPIQHLYAIWLGDNKVRWTLAKDRLEAAVIAAEPGAKMAEILGEYPAAMGDGSEKHNREFAEAKKAVQRKLSYLQASKVLKNVEEIW